MPTPADEQAARAELPPPGPNDSAQAPDGERREYVLPADQVPALWGRA